MVGFSSSFWQVTILILWNLYVYSGWKLYCNILLQQLDHKLFLAKLNVEMQTPAWDRIEVFSLAFLCNWYEVNKTKKNNQLLLNLCQKVKFYYEYHIHFKGSVIVAKYQ